MIINRIKNFYEITLFNHTIKITLQDTDAAGILFFANQFKMVHLAYEMLLLDMEYPISKILNESDIILPIVHAEATFKAPVLLDDFITIFISMEKISSSTFSLLYKLVNQKAEAVGSAKTVHVAVSKKFRTKSKLPLELSEKLKLFNEQNIRDN